LEGESLKIVIANHIYLETELSSTTQLQVLQALNKLGHPSTLVVPYSGNGNSVPSVPNVERVQIPSQHWAVSAAVFNLKLLVRLARMIRRDRPDLIMIDHLSVLAAAPYILLGAISRRFPRFVFDVRSQPVEGVGFAGYFREAEYLISLAISSRVAPGLTFLTRPMGAHELSRVRSTRAYGVWESGVDLEVFEPERWKHRGVQIRRGLGLDDSFVVFYHGDVSPNRGLDLAIHAFAQLSRTGRTSKPTFVILGDGSARSELERLAQDLRAPVRFLGRVPYSDVPGYIAMADVALIPLPDHDDWRYQHPLKFTEYLAMKVPVIVPTSPAFTTSAGDSQAVLYLSEVTPEAIADQVAHCYDKRAFLKEWARDSRQVADRYTWERIASRLAAYGKTIGAA
jgi:glycosyltransferase involved in cell wall biosynthesis